MSFQRGYGPDIGSGGSRFPNIRPAESRLPKRPVPMDMRFWRGVVCGVLLSIIAGWAI